MPSAGPPALLHGPDSVEANVVIPAGRLVEPDGNTKRVKLATANSERVLGVTFAPSGPRSGNGQLDAHPRPPTVAVQYTPMDVYVDYSAAAAWGQLLVCTGDGKVGPAGGGATFAQIVGRCTSEAGVAAGAVGRVRIHV